MKTETKFVWVVEMKSSKSWAPCASAFLLRKDALGYSGVLHWKENNPTESFRVSKYVRLKP